MAKTKFTYKRLCPELADELGEIKTERKELEKKERILVDGAKALTWKGQKGVARKVVKTDGQKKIQFAYTGKGADFVMVLSEFDCLDVSWRDEFEALYVEMYGRKKWNKWLKNAPRRRQTQLDVNEKE